MVLDHCYLEESLASATDGLLAASSTSVESLFYSEFYIELEPFMPSKSPPKQTMF